MDTPQELVLTSPGGLSRGSRYKTFSEPAATNRTLAEAFEKLGLVERVGNGTPANLIPTPSCGKRSLEYESDGMRVVLRIFDGTFDERMAVLVAGWRGKSNLIGCCS